MTDVTLKDHLETQLRWVDRYFQSKIEDLTKLVERAEEALKIKLDAMTASNYATQIDVEKADKLLEERIRDLEQAKSYGEGRAAFIAVVTAILTSVIITGIAAFLR